MAPTLPQQKVSRRAFLRLATLSGATLLAAGACRRDNPSVATPPAGEGPITPPPAPQGGGQGTVKWAEFYSTLTPEQETALGIDAAGNREWMAGIAGQFERENPGWQVEFEAVSHAEVDQRSAYDFNANVSHDLVFARPELMARHGKIGDLLDLEAYVSKLSWADQQDLSWGPTWQAARVKGKQLGIPVALQAHALAYNRELCQKAGIDPAGSPQSPAHLLEVSKKLTTPDQKTWGLVLSWPNARSGVERVYTPLVWHFGGVLYDENTGMATLANEANRQAAQWLLDAIDTYKVTPNPADRADGVATAIESFTGGRAGQLLGFGSYDIAALERVGLISGCVPAARACRADRAGVLPVPTSGQAAFATGWCLAIHALSKQPEMAFRLLQVILRPDNLRKFPDGGLPARLATWQTNDYRTPFYEAWLLAVRKSRPMPRTPYYWELADTVGTALEDILSRKLSIADALQQAEDGWNSRYAGA